VTIDRSAAVGRYRHTVNPAWADLVEAIGLPVENLRGEGSWLFTTDGAGLLDMVAGFGTAVLGHNPPELIAALKTALDVDAPMTAPLGIVPEAGLLAARLLALAGHGLSKVQFGSTGAEAVDTALKLAASKTGRRRFLSVRGGFHGLSMGATSLAGSNWWREPFPDLWLPVDQCDANDVDRLDRVLAKRDIAAVVLEVVPGSDAMDGWSATAMRNCAELCRTYGALLVIDEVQTALGRTSGWFAFHEAGAGFEPDMVIVSKALTGGIVPLSGVLMTDAVYEATYAAPGRAKIHGSTLSGNRLAMSCGLAVLDIIERDNLAGRAARLGSYIRDTLARSDASPPAVYGRGCLLAIELGADAQEANERCIGLLRSGILVTGVSHAPRFIRITPALTMSDDDAEVFVEAVTTIRQ
jgi:ornithine--oxo-acid transaminase